MEEKTKLETIKALYMELDDKEKIKFQIFLERCNEKRKEELDKLKQEIIDEINKVAKMSTEYIKKTFRI